MTGEQPLTITTHLRGSGPISERLRFALLASGHFVLTFATLLGSLDLTMAAFDGGGSARGGMALLVVHRILTFPLGPLGGIVLTSVQRDGFPLEHLLLLLNSVLWAAVGVRLWPRAPTSERGRRRGWMTGEGGGLSSLIICAIIVAAPAAPAQQMPRLALDRPSWTAVEPFTSVAALRELPGGAVLVSDAEERGVFLITAAGRTVRRLGRNGSGPGEYGTPTRLIPLPGDSTMLLDRDARRFLLLDPKGGIVETRPFPPSVAAASAFMRGADRQGRVYFTEGPFAGVPTGPSTLQVRRWNRNSGRVDDVATLLAPNPKPVERTLPNGKQVVIRRLMPFTPQDEWVVAPSGRIALVRAVPYRVEWWETNGRITGGRPVAISAVPVTDADKQAREPEGPPYRLEYPPTKPPFREGGVVVDDKDRVYVRRERAFGALQTTWDVFDARGVHLGAAVVPSHKHIVAISSRFIYVVRTDDDDLRWLEAYAQ